MKKFHFILLFGLFFLNVFSQSLDSVLLLQKVDSVYISAAKKIALKPVKKEALFELEQNEKLSFNTLEKILDNQSNISLKKYGEGQISTISVKGFSASQTNISWNGVNINSPLLGQADISTISVGNNTTLKLTETNSDNIAGEVVLKNNIDYYKKNEFKVISAASSFGSFNQAISYEFNKNRKLYSNTNASFNYNFNRYKYQNKSLPNQEEIYLENGETLNVHFEQINGFRFKRNNELRLFAKVFYADRNIAPTIYEFLSTKNQKDNLYLGKLEWRKSDPGKNYHLQISSAFVHQLQSVKLSKNSTSIKYGSNSLQTDLWFKKEIINNLNFYLSMNNIIENGFSNNYSEDVLRNKLNLKTAFQYQVFKDLNLKFSVAEIIVNSKFSKPLPALKIKYSKNNLPANILLQFDYSRKVRFPSLNDLYWNPGGNINLKEEYAHNFNFNFIVERDFKPLEKRNKFYFKNKFEFFNVFSENYIQWQPTNQGFWEPNNIGNVYSRGITNDFTLKYTLKENFSLQNTLSYNFTRITKRNETEQLIYAPMNSVFNSTIITTKWIALMINQQFISKKFTNYDNSLSIKKYYLLDFIISREFQINKLHQFYAAFEMNNVLNKTYFTYINRALPKRNFSLKLKYTIQ